jgi:hypothetical protein
VRKIDTKDTDAFEDELFNDDRVRTGRAERGNDFGEQKWL